MKGLLRVHDAARYEHHMCSRNDCGGVFTDLPMTQWMNMQGERCRHCGSPRFVKVCLKVLVLWLITETAGTRGKLLYPYHMWLVP